MHRSFQQGYRSPEPEREGGPFGSTVMAAMYVYNKAFVTKSYGPGQTEAVILFLFTAIIAVSQAVMNKRKEVEAEWMREEV